MRNIHLFLIFILVFQMAALRAQIFEPEGLNMPGQWNQWVNPPANKPAFAGASQVSAGKINLITTGLRRYQTLVSIDSASGDTSAGTYSFLFTSGPETNYYQNKWSGVNVSINTIQNYILGAASDNNVVLENGKFYTINWQDAGYQDTRAVFMQISAEPVEIDSATTNLGPDEEAQSMQPVTINAFLSDTPAVDEFVYVRWSVDAFASSSIARMTVDGKQAFVQVPGLPGGNQVQWYIFSSSISNPPADYDLLTIRFLNNQGSNFTYTVKQQMIAVNLGQDQSLCPESSINLQPDESYDQYLWSTGDTTASISVNVAGIYSIWVKRGDAIGRDTIQVTQSDTPAVDLGPDRLLCGGASLILDAGAGFSNYAWIGGSNNQTLEVENPGLYFVTVTNEAGCEGFDLVNVTTSPAAVAGFTFQEGPGPLTITFSNTGSHAETWYWDFNGDGFNDLIQGGTVTNTYPSAGTYQVRLIAENACGADTLVQAVTVSSTVNNGYLPVPAGCLIYPNPSGNILMINANGKFRAELFSAEGRLIDTFMGSTGRLIDVSHISAGTYLIRIFQEQNLPQTAVLFIRH